MNRYIAIECETGSAGMEIASGVAEALNIPCYGKDILEMIAEEQSLTQYEMKKYLESISESVLYSYYLINEVKCNRTAGLPSEGIIYHEHRKKINELASRGSAVFVGQCATDILKSLGTVTRVFIKSNEEAKRRYINSKIKNQNFVADDLMRHIDQMQERFYFSNANARWRDADNYDIVLDSSKSEVQACVDAICLEFAKSNEKDDS